MEARRRVLSHNVSKSQKNVLVFTHTIDSLANLKEGRKNPVSGNYIYMTLFFVVPMPTSAENAVPGSSKKYLFAGPVGVYRYCARNPRSTSIEVVLLLLLCVCAGGEAQLSREMERSTICRLLLLYIQIAYLKYSVIVCAIQQ